MRVLYAGDGPIGGAANYVLGVLNFLKADWHHVPPSRSLPIRLLQSRPYDAIVLSDFPCHRTSDAAQRLIASQVLQGTGLLMVGGWASFSGAHGGWRGSLVERLLPVRCRAADDRVHCPAGALLLPHQFHPILGANSFHQPPAICGVNAVRPTPSSITVLSARRIVSQVGAATHVRVSLHSRAYPVLVIDRDPRKRIAAFATDLAPHWCGGLVDWGSRRLTLPVSRGLRVEVGDRYVHFVSSLLRWLAGGRG